MKERIITAIAALIVFVPLVIYGSTPFTVLVYLMAAIGLTELMRMRKIEIFSIPSILAMVCLWLILLPAEAETIPVIGMMKSELVLLFIVLLLTYMVFSKNKFHFNDAGFLVLSVIYVGMGFYYLIVARGDGLQYLLFILFIIWTTDTGAYFVGRAIGKRKLWPEISPNKTIEGAAGGIVLALIVAVLFDLISPLPGTTLTVLAVAVLISVFGQIGDLVESAYKRHYKVKDSGNILPGHGGILDRLDSILFVLPILHFIHFIS